MQAKGVDAVVMAVDVMMMVMMPVIVLMIMPVRMIVSMPVPVPVPVPVIVGAVIDMAGLIAVGLLAQPAGHIDRFGRRIIKAGVK